MVEAIKIGTEIGRAMARDVAAQRIDADWTGLDPQDADQLVAAGIQHGTPAWTLAEEAAEAEYLAMVGIEVRMHNGQCAYGDWIALVNAPHDVCVEVLETMGISTSGRVDVNGQMWVYRVV